MLSSPPSGSLPVRGPGDREDNLDGACGTDELVPDRRPAAPPDGPRAASRRRRRECAERVGVRHVERWSAQSGATPQRVPVPACGRRHRDGLRQTAPPQVEIPGGRGEALGGCSSDAVDRTNCSTAAAPARVSRTRSRRSTLRIGARVHPGSGSTPKTTWKVWGEVRKRCRRRRRRGARRCTVAPEPTAGAPARDPSADRGPPAAGRADVRGRPDALGRRGRAPTASKTQVNTGNE